MAKTKQSCFGEGTKARSEGKTLTVNPYTSGSWQFKAWADGWSAAHEAYPEDDTPPPGYADMATNPGNGWRLPTGATVKAIRADQARVDALQFEFSDYMPDACAHHCALLTVTVENVFNPTPSQISWLTRLTRKVEALQAKYAKRYESAMQTA